MLLAVERTLSDVRTLAAYHDLHAGGSFLVLGLGPSMARAPSAPPIRVIGLNDCWRFHRADYLLALDGPDAFSEERRRGFLLAEVPYFMPRHTRAAWLQLKPEMDITELQYVAVKAGMIPRRDLDPSVVYGSSVTSACVAVGLAIFMGARFIGVLGVDLAGHPFLKRRIGEINVQMGHMRNIASAQGRHIYNLSDVSALTAFPRLALCDFLDLSSDLGPVLDGKSLGKDNRVGL